jgi:large subunit ribosomal protein L3
MGTRSAPRKGSLQFWPRKRIKKFLPRVNWNTVLKKNPDKTGLMGFIGYKAGMASLFVKDNTEHSMTKGKRIILPVTLVECPPMKILSARFYKNGTVMTEVCSENLDKELKKIIKLPKSKKNFDEVKDYDDLSIIAYSVVKRTGIKKTPDLTEIALSGSLEDKIKWVKDNLGKEITIESTLKKNELVDVRGLTKGKGLQGPVKRSGLKLKSHKSEKGRRRPGSLGPWHPARVTYRAHLAGQLGLFTRVTYNNKVIDLGKSNDKFKNIKNYGDIKTDFVTIAGSLQGPSKRQLLLSPSIRASKKQNKKSYEVVEYK